MVVKHREVIVSERLMISNDFWHGHEIGKELAFQGYLKVRHFYDGMFGLVIRLDVTGFERIYGGSIPGFNIFV